MVPESGAQSLVPAFRVRINRTDPPAAAVTDMLFAAVHEDIDAPGMFELRLNNWDMARLQVTWVDDNLFAAGNEVEIQMGYVNHLETLLVGEITGLEPEFHAGEPPTVTVRGYDRRHRLFRERRTQSFLNVKDSDAASQIAGAAGLTADVVDSGVTHEYVLQNNQTDMEFLQERARRIGYEVLVLDKTLSFRPYQNAAQEILTLTRDGDLIEFSPRLTTRNQFGQAIVRGWNPKDKVKIVAKAGPGDEGTKMGGSDVGPAAANTAFGASSASWVDLPVSSQAEADQMATGLYRQMALAYITGDGLTRGRTDLRAGKVIKLDGLGKRFGGLYYVTSTLHSYAPRQGYQTAFTVRRNAT